VKASLNWHRWVQTLGVLVALALLDTPTPVQAQIKFDDDRVLLQGFYWESYRHGDPKFPKYGKKRWYDIVRERAGLIRDGRFDLVWLPPPSYAGDRSAGYNPRQYFKLDNSYGNLQQHRALLAALLKNGIEPVADIVVNHRDGEGGWATFKNPDWGTWAVTRDDEAFSRQDSPIRNTPVAKRGAPEERPKPYATYSNSTYQYDSFRDLDHTNAQVRRDIIKYLLQLKSVGYRGWRYDMVHGYHARWIGVYNKRSQPTFSVGEYDWDRQSEQRGWIWHTATNRGNFRTTSAVFDFRTFFTLKDSKGKYNAWYGFDQGPGLLGDTTDGQPWRQRAVTFLENHDTGYRTDEDGKPQLHNKFDTFQNNWEVEQAYAYILTHPGVPTVYWKHYFDWGILLKSKIRSLINARKVAGVHAGSPLYTQSNARQKGIYAARIDGKRGQLYIRVGGSDRDWQPYYSGYQNYQEYASGTGWKVWVALPGNPKPQQATRRGAFPIPTYRPATQINVPTNWVN
jgi:alpha-amylase